ncbi:MAG: methylated-DNA--[protein]-cysteine S-methyltransferase, partial [Dehalococcoidales bacterium]
MTGKLKYITFNTDMGWIGLLASEKGLLATSLPQQSDSEACQQLGKKVNQANRSTSSFSGLMERLRFYFSSGEEVDFPDELDVSGATPFHSAVWQATRLIPYGETRSYLWVARQINKPGAARAVGQAMGRNPLPIIGPCHRVIASDGGLGGFGGGLEMKQQLLRLEGG